MKKTACLILTLAASVYFCASCPAAGPVEIKAAQFLDFGNPGEKGFHLLVETINKAAKGELVVKIVGGPESIPPRSQIEAVRLGAVDMVFVPCSWYGSIVPEAAVMNLSKLDAWDERKTGWYDYLVEKHRSAGIRYIGTSDVAGPFYMMSKEPIKSPEELKGKRFRHAPTYVFFKDFGIIPITTEHSEIYTGLERNLFVGLASKLETLTQLGLHEVCKYVVGPGFWPNSGNSILMNEKKFSGLPPHLQQLILDSQKNAEKPMSEIREELVAKTWETLRAKGMKHVEWSSEDSKAFLSKIDDVTFRDRTKKMSTEEANKIKKMLGH